MRDSITAADRSLDGLFAETRNALQRRSEARTGAAFRRLREAIETHFEQEERLYYSTIVALRPEAREEVQGFARAHGRFRRQFASMGWLLEAGALETARLLFEQLAERFFRHEVREEQFLSSLDREAAAPR